MTRVEKVRKWLENHWFFSTIMIIGLIVAPFTDLIDKIGRVFSRAQPKASEPIAPTPAAFSPNPVKARGTFTVSCDRLDMCADLHISGDGIRWNNGVCGLPTDVPGTQKGLPHTPTIIKADGKEAFPWTPKWPPIEHGYRCQNCWSESGTLPYLLFPPNTTITNVKVLNPEGPFTIGFTVPSNGPVKDRDKLVLQFRAPIGTIASSKALIVWEGITEQ